MEELTALTSDPVIQFVIFVVCAMVIFDISKLILTWIWQKLGGKNLDGD